MRVKFNFVNSYSIICICLILISAKYYPENPYRPYNKQEEKFIAAIKAAEPINVNTADVEDLVKLKGIGKKRAETIITYRNRHGKFRTFSSLKKVQGLPKNFEKDNKYLVKFD